MTGAGLSPADAAAPVWEDWTDVRRRVVDVLAANAIVVSPAEREHIEVVDFGLGRLSRTGLQILTYANTARCCAKEMVLFGGQTCAEHLHPPIDGREGKEETFRVRYGTVHLYVPGEPAAVPVARPDRIEHYTVWHEIVLSAGDQYTVTPGTKHWFHARELAIVSEFSTQSRDEYDQFTDPEIMRVP